MAVDSLILVTNPGSSSRKYALYKRGREIANAHIEHEKHHLVMHSDINGEQQEDIKLSIDNLAQSLDAILNYWISKSVINSAGDISAAAIRIVAPSKYFLENRILDNHAIKLLKHLYSIAPLHIESTLQEIEELHKMAINRLIGVSDSAFFAKKPDYTWNYGISLSDADNYDIKRFGYHGLSMSSVVSQYKETKYRGLSKVVICHLGSGASVAAVYNGQPIDSTMGFSPNEGLIMATRSGTFDLYAAKALASSKNISLDEVLNDLQHNSGLLGISGKSSDIRELIELEKHDDYRASLSLSMYVYSVRQSIAKMAASMDGIDALIFTGTVGHRSAIMRERIISGLSFLGLAISGTKNNATTESDSVSIISLRTRQKPILVIKTDETKEMYLAAKKLI